MTASPFVHMAYACMCVHVVCMHVRVYYADQDLIKSDRPFDPLIRWEQKLQQQQQQERKGLTVLTLNGRTTRETRFPVRESPCNARQGPSPSSS